VLQPRAQVPRFAEIPRGLGQKGQIFVIEPANPLPIVGGDLAQSPFEQPQNQAEFAFFPTFFPTFLAHCIQVRVASSLQQIAQGCFVGCIGIIQGFHWHRVGENSRGFQVLPRVGKEEGCLRLVDLHPAYPGEAHDPDIACPRPRAG